MKKTLTLLAAGLMLAGAVNAQPVTNAGMETWRNYTVSGNAYESPTDWYSLDSTLSILAPTLGSTGKQHIFKSSDKHNGDYAAKIMTRNYGLLGSVPGGLANAKITINVATASYALTGGTAVTTRVSTASAWLKYVPKGTGDSASLIIQAVLSGQAAGGGDSIVGTSLTKIAAKAAYGQVTSVISYVNNTVVPDHIQVAFLSSNLLAGTAVDSSALYVDDVTITTNVGVSQSIFKANVVTVYPNPATTSLSLSSNEKSNLIWEAVAANGQVIATKEFVQSANVSLNNIAAGIYFYRVLNDKKELVQTGKFIIK